MTYNVLSCQNVLKNLILNNKFNFVVKLQHLCKSTIMIKKSLILLIFLSLTTSCIKKEVDPVTGKRKNYEPNVEKRARAAAGDGIVLGGSGKIEYEFSNANPIWRASLMVLEDIPLATANYAGGVISTDWYSSSNSAESIKIQIVFNDTKISVSSFDVKGFKKKCKTAINCSVSNTDRNFNNSIKNKIIEKTKIIYQKDSKTRKK